MQVSEVIRIRQQIEEECRAARTGFQGLAATGRHEFINARYRRLDILHSRLVAYVGEEGATELIAKIHNEVME